MKPKAESRKPKAESRKPTPETLSVSQDPTVVATVWHGHGLRRQPEAAELLAVGKTATFGAAIASGWLSYSLSACRRTPPMR